MQRHIFDTIGGVIRAREQAGVVVLFILVWPALQCFTTLISATNRAWGADAHNIWRLPLKGLALLGLTAGAVLLGMAAPLLIKMAKDWYFPVRDFRSWVYVLGSFVIPLLVVFLTLNLFYRLAPRRPTRFAEVWAAALCATVLLQAADSLFVIYPRNFATLNMVYGAFGGIMALLLWIYLSGCIFIFGACLVRSAGRSAFSTGGSNYGAWESGTGSGIRPMNKLKQLWSNLRSSFWFMPSLIVVVSIVFAVVLIEADSAGSDRWLARWPRLFGAGAEGARGMMSTIAGSMMTVVGVTFSMILVVLALASSQYTSRILRNFMRSRVTQVVLGIFAGIFTYCLIVLRTIRGGDEGAFVPSLAVFFGFVLALGGVGALMFFIHHIASSIQASSIIASVAQETIAAIDRLFPGKTWTRAGRRR